MTDVALSGGDQRFTHQFLSRGQPRPYADHETQVRVTFEWVPFGSDGFAPYAMPEPAVRRYLVAASLGFTELTNADRDGTTEDHYRSRLQYLKPIDPDENGSSGVWEFLVTTPYTD